MDKRMSAPEVVAQLQDGMTIGIGGWGPRRKPMALVREILRSDLRDLTIVAYGGADVGMLCAAGKVKKVVFAFVSLDFIPLEPYFRQARQSGAIEVMEILQAINLRGTTVLVATHDTALMNRFHYRKLRFDNSRLVELVFELAETAARAARRLGLDALGLPALPAGATRIVLPDAGGPHRRRVHHQPR